MSFLHYKNKPNTKPAGTETQRQRKWPNIIPTQHPTQVLEEGRVGQPQLVNSLCLQQWSKPVCAESLQLSPSGLGADLVFTFYLIFFLCLICVKVKETLSGVFIWNVIKILGEEWDHSLCYCFWGCPSPPAWAAFHCCKGQNFGGMGVFWRGGGVKCV